MRPLKYQRLWLLIGYIQLLMVIWLSLFTDGAPFYDEQLTFLSLGIDTYQHMLAYAFLMIWFGQLGTGLKYMTGTAALLLLFGTGLEWLQGFTSNRESSLSDLLANAAGITTGLLLTLTPIRQVLSRVEDLILTEVQVSND
jgi:VanZ family protein